jgi:hypothetical protein
MRCPLGLDVVGNPLVHAPDNRLPGMVCQAKS